MTRLDYIALNPASLALMAWVADIIWQPHKEPCGLAFGREFSKRRRVIKTDKLESPSELHIIKSSQPVLLPPLLLPLLYTIFQQDWVAGSWRRKSEFQCTSIISFQRPTNTLAKNIGAASVLLIISAAGDVWQCWLTAGRPPLDKSQFNYPFIFPSSYLRHKAHFLPQSPCRCLRCSPTSTITAAAPLVQTKHFINLLISC